MVLAAGNTLSFLGLLASSFCLGALHALAPGHGKTIVAAYLVGNRAHWYHAAHLGLVVTIVHTSGVVILGLLATYGMSHLDTHQIEHWLELVAAALVMAVGGWMLWRASTGHNHHHHHHINGHHSTSDGPETTQPERTSIWSLTALGISGGILPCPTAMAPLLYGLGSGQPSRGLWAVLAFSLGLAGVLVVVGLAVLQARKFVERGFSESRWIHYIPLISALLVTMFGLVLLVRTLLGSSPHEHFSMQ